MDTKELEKLPNKNEIETAHIIVELIEYEHDAVVSKSLLKKSIRLNKCAIICQWRGT